MDQTPAAATLSISLVDIKNRTHMPTLEDWYIHVDGVCYGYLYRCDKPNGYAVGIGKPASRMEKSNISASRAAKAMRSPTLKSTMNCY